MDIAQIARQAGLSAQDIAALPIGVDIKRELFQSIGVPNWMADAGVTESGQPTLTDRMSPEAMNALQGYAFDWQPGARNAGTLTAYRPDGGQLGQWSQPADNSLLQDLATWGALAGGGFGLAGLAGAGPMAGMFGGGAAGSGAASAGGGTAAGTAGAGGTATGAAAGGGAGAAGLSAADQIAMLSANGMTDAAIAAANPGLASAGGLAGVAGASGGIGNALSALLPKDAAGWAKLGIPLASSALQSYQAGRALDAQQAATEAAMAEQRRQYDTTRADYAPWRAAGSNALQQLMGGMNAVPTAEEVMAQPGYQFGLQQGQQALDRKAAAAGGRISGASLKAAQGFANDYATSKYGDAYNRTQDRLNRLAQIAGLGISGTSGTAAAGANTSNALSGLITGQGNANAAGAMAQGNIWGNALGQLGATLFPQQTPSGRSNAPGGNQLWGSYGY